MNPTFYQNPRQLFVLFCFVLAVNLNEPHLLPKPSSAFFCFVLAVNLNEPHLLLKGSREQRKMEETGCEVIRGAPPILEVKG